jgi:hypothetical protein
VGGFEGDLEKKGPNKGHRTINGWKNAISNNKIL